MAQQNETRTETTAPTRFDRYRVFPTNAVPAGTIACGWDALREHVQHAFDAGRRCIALDGVTGVDWDRVTREVAEVAPGGGVAISDMYLDATATERLVAPFLGDGDPLFGFVSDLELRQFLDAGRLAACDGTAPCVVVGTGASLLDGVDAVVWLEYPRDALQQRFKDGWFANVGNQTAASAAEAYKRAYFIDWPVLNHHKAAVISRIDVMVDMQDADAPTLMTGDDFRAALDRLARSPFRARPWFAAGPWGGTWMQEHFAGVDTDADNLAWSFELIVPENGIVLGDGETQLEVTFDFLMYQAHDAVLGKAADLFGYEFPIRFDYLDTMGGGNLSIQCHPQRDYMRQQFGENFTQDETYYIVQASEDSRVYLGLRDGAEPAAFQAALEASATSGEAMDVDAFVASYPSAEHELYLIPAGTVHGSGTDNLVLEISATPYIYTFKMYDWVRLDLNGKPRQLNIARAFANLRVDRDESVVRDHLMGRPRLEREGDGWQEYVLGDIPELFFQINRIHLEADFRTDTDGVCLLCNVVAGAGIRIRSDAGGDQVFYPGETFVIPAATGAYEMSALEGVSATIVKAFVKPGWAWERGE